MIVVWRVTQRCNLSCPFCCYDRRVERPRRDAHVETILRFGAVLSDYQRATGESVLVSWMGGEPLLWAPLRALTEQFTRRFGVRISTTTNGTSLGSATVREHIIEHYSELTVSVDGIGTVHDDLRGWRGGFAHLRRVVPKLVAERQLSGRGPLLRVNVVLMRDTVGDFERLCAELADWGIDEITFNQLGGEDRPEFLPAHRLLPSHAEWLATNIPRLRHELAQRGVRLGGETRYLGRLVATANGQRIPVRDCGPGERFLFIDERGYVAPCSFTTDRFGLSLHEIDTWEDLQRLPRRFAATRAASRAAACDDCHSTNVFEKFHAVLSRAPSAATPVTSA
ncbi:MAG TPA: radical SAM protein [Gemmatimonadaceae bacterium]|nr:radical SAM protein [Gemmatimonadaceae bacterium]